MADNGTKVTVRNTARGVRGLNAVEGYREFEPGQGGEVTLTAAERKSAESTGYFTFGADAKDAEPTGDPAKLPGTHAELDALAAAETITFADGVKTVAEKQAAITAARAAKAGGGSVTTGGAQRDELDSMDDATLLTTAAALSGKPESELAGQDREALLKLARGDQ
jgi:hypothetical protein